MILVVCKRVVRATAIGGSDNRAEGTHPDTAPDFRRLGGNESGRWDKRTLTLTLSRPTGEGTAIG